MDKSFWKNYGMPITKEEAAKMFPVEFEEKILTMDKPLIIESACPGWQVGGERFPAVPIAIKDQISEVSESIKAGAVAIHVHPRDPDTGEAQINPRLLKVIMDGVFEEVGDCVTLNHTWWPVPDGEIDYIKDTRELLELGNGNKYVQGSVVLPVGTVASQRTIFTDKATVEGLKWLTENKVKPIYQLYDTYTHFHFKNYWDQKVDPWDPYVLNLHMGKHNSHAIHQNPEAFMQLITNYLMIKKTVPNSIIGIYPGGRNWLPILILGIMMGAELVRVGIEDCYWMWPHRNDLIKKNSDTVKIAVEIAGILNRRVVTDPKEARSILGMELV